MKPNQLNTVQQLEDALSEPTPACIETLAGMEGDILLLGVGGKMGPTLARMAKRASDAAGIKRRVIGVSRFKTGGLQLRLESEGIEAISCDLLEHDQVQELPDAPNVVYMAGMKFGATGHQSLTWAMNSYLPSVICRRYRHSRIVAFSTGNVYGLTPVEGGGSRETDQPNPVGEYAMSCLGRERMFEYFSERFEMPATLIRLNYACELRYGVLVDLAQRVWSGQPIDLAMGFFNTIWQGDANAMSLQAFRFASAPPLVLNLTGPELVSVRWAAERFGQMMDKAPAFIGAESPTALLSNAQQAFHLMGKPRVALEEMMEWVAAWVARGGETLGKATHFESRDGKF